MSAKTKIVVVKMKHVILTGVLLGILLLPVSYTHLTLPTILLV